MPYLRITLYSCAVTAWLIAGLVGAAGVNAYTRANSQDSPAHDHALAMIGGILSGPFGLVFAAVTTDLFPDGFTLSSNP